MVFSSLAFLYYFLPLTVILYYFVPGKAKNMVLLTASLLFYFYGEPVYTILLLFSALSDYLHGRFIERHRGDLRAKYGLFSSLLINIGLLGCFKYADFIIKSMNGILGTEIGLLGLSLPLGISFFTFQTMSYSIDIYRGEISAQKNFFTFFTYVSMFPQLIAGPIVRYQEVADSLRENRKITIDHLAYGIKRFIIGLSKKVLIANQLGEFVLIFREAASPSILFYWSYAFAFTLHIYFDFSGYSDMAIGLGKIFGFSFPENFQYPLSASSITDFWRRWHQTLTRWFRDYVYIPLGGNRLDTLRWARNILSVWFLTGLWHGAAWNFVLWGMYFGLLLILEKHVLLRPLSRISPLFQHIYVILLVSFSFVIFNGDGLSGFFQDARGLLGFEGIPFYTPETGYQLLNYGGIFLAAAIGSTPVIKQAKSLLFEAFPLKSVKFLLEPSAYLFLLFTVTVYLVNQSYNPFIYFRF